MSKKTPKSKPLFKEGDIVTLKGSRYDPTSFCNTFKVDYVSYGEYSEIWRYFRNHSLKDSYEYEDELELVTRRNYG